MKRLKKMVETPNPPTQRHMGKVLGCTQQNIGHHIHKTLKMKTKKKGLVHGLSAENIETRRQGSLAL
jgi:hypothetical protein